MRRIKNPENCIRARNTLEMLGYPVTLYEAEAFWDWRCALAQKGIMPLPLDGDQTEDFALAIIHYNPKLQDPDVGFIIEGFSHV